MELYLPGLSSPDQIATKWLLKQRGYKVFCSVDLWNPSYYINNGVRPSEREFRRNQAQVMAHCSAVVITPEIEPAEGAVIVHLCREMGAVPVLYEELPAQAPPATRWREVADALDLTRTHRKPVRTLRVLLHRVLQRAGQLENGFNERFGWFLTNPNKVQQRKVRHYAVPESKPLTTN